MLRRKKRRVFEEELPFEETAIGGLTIVFFILLLAVLLPWTLHILTEAFISAFNIPTILNY